MMCKLTNIVMLMVLLFIMPLSYAVTSKLRSTDVCELMTSLNINGKEIDRLLIDTGATGGIHLKETVIKKLPGNPAKFIRDKRFADAFEKVRINNFYIAPQLTINGELIPNVPLTSFVLWGNQAERQHIEPINGVVGLDSFGDNELLIDLQKMIIKAAPHIEPDVKIQWEKIPIARTDYGIELTAIGDSGKRLRLILDTGANVSMLFDEESKNKPVMTEVIVGNKQVVKVMRHVFAAPQLAKGGIDGLLGCNYFKGKRLIITKDHIYVTGHKERLG